MRMILTVHVKPGARHESVEWIDEDTLKISVTAAAQKGRATEAVVEVLATELGIAKSTIILHRGATSRIKQFKIQP